MVQSLVAASFLALAMSQPQPSDTDEPVKQLAAPTAAPVSAKPEDMDIDLERFADCKPDPRFMDRFTSYDFKKVRGKVKKDFIKGPDTDGLYADSKELAGGDRLKIGTYANSKNVYSAGTLSGSNFQHAPFVGVYQRFSEDPSYKLWFQETITIGRKKSAEMDVASIAIPVNGDFRTFARTHYTSPTRNCVQGMVVKNKFTSYYKPGYCTSYASSQFTLDKEIFDLLAQSDPSQPIPIYAKDSDGSFRTCPFYLSPLSFRAVGEVQAEQQGKMAKTIEKAKKKARRAAKAEEARRKRNEERAGSRRH